MQIEYTKAGTVALAPTEGPALNVVNPIGRPVTVTCNVGDNTITLVAQVEDQSEAGNNVFGSYDIPMSAATIGLFKQLFQSVAADAAAAFPEFVDLTITKFE